MPTLHQTIRGLIASDCYLIGLHASERLEERGIMEWQVVSEFDRGILICERTDATPNPAIEILTLLPDGMEVKSVWSYLKLSGVAKLVTVHYRDENDDEN